MKLLLELHRTLGLLRPAAAAAVCALLAIRAGAANYYFDVNGATAGSGVTNGGTYAWEGANWTTSSGGTAATVNWPEGNFPRFAAGTDATGSYTVTIGNSHDMVGMFQEDQSANATLTISGAGALNIITNGGGLTPFGTFVQGFFTRGSCNCVLSCAVTGDGGIGFNTSGGTGGGSLFLYGTNTFKGGIQINTSGGLNFNSSASFGTGPVQFNTATIVLANPAGTSPITITNTIIPQATAGTLIFVAAAASPVTFTSSWTNASGLNRFSLGNTPFPSSSMTIAGKIFGASGNMLKDGTGTLIINNTNANNVTTTVTNGTLEIGPSGSVAGTVVVGLSPTNGLLKLDGSTALASSATLKTFSSGEVNNSVNLNFSGTNTIFALYIDGVLQTSGTWGAIGSSAVNQSSVFTGTGVLNIPAAPVIVQQPSSLSTYPQTPSRTFSVVVTGDQATMTYQWKRNSVNLTDNGTSISGSQTATLTLSPPYTAGNYTCAIQNVAGSTNSSVAALTILATNDYVNAVLATTGQTFGSPALIAYWRLDETNGTTANDWVGLHSGTYVNANLNQPGFSAVSNSDPAIGIPATTPNPGNSRDPANSGVMIITNSPSAFAFGGFPFALEAWAMSTNFGAGVKQRLISTLSTTGTGGYGFGFPANNKLEFTSGGIDDYDITLGTPISAGVWHHYVASFDGNNMNFYLDGAPVGSVAIPVTIPNPANQFTLGNNPYTFANGTGFLPEQLFGAIDEVAIYNDAIDAATVQAHYLARYSDAPVTTTLPVATPPTNYVSLTSTLTESAGGGVGTLTYQWYKGSGTSTPVGGNSPQLVLSSLQLSDAGSYHCVVSDTASHTADSGLASVAVLPIPTTASQLNLTNGLILHLPFDADYNDISGRLNNGTPVGAPSFVGSGVIGTDSLHYGTTSGVGTNYVTLGVRPDLQFGATTDFTVAYWTRGNNGSLPFFCDSSAGLDAIVTNAGGFYFGPSTNGNGSWEAGLSSSVSVQHAVPPAGSIIINDGNWHHVVHTIKRSGSLITYVDGVAETPYAVSFLSGSIDTTNPANIGQDGTGGRVLADAQGDIDDVAVWNRVITPLEVSGMYLAGATNHVSFAPPVSNPAPQVTIQIQRVGSQYQLVWTGGGTLQASPVVTGGYTNVTGATSPYTLPVSSGPQLFYRVQF